MTLAKTKSYYSKSNLGKLQRQNDIFNILYSETNFLPLFSELEMKMEPSSPTDKRQQFSRCSSTNSVITSNSSAQNSGE